MSIKTNGTGTDDRDQPNTTNATPPTAAASGGDEPPTPTTSSTEMEWPDDGELPDQSAEWTLAKAAQMFDSDSFLSTRRSQLALYRLPKYLLWGLEALSKSMRKGGKDAAATCAIELGLPRLRHFPGLNQICGARAKVVPLGDPEVLDWFDRFGEIDQTTNQSGTLPKAYKRQIPEALAKELGLLAADLGMPTTQLGILALMAGFLGANDFVRHAYQECIVSTLRELRDRLKVRSNRALELAAKAAPAESSQRNYSMRDILGPFPRPRKGSA